MIQPQTEHQTKQSILSVILLLSLSFLFLALSLQQYLHHRIDEIESHLLASNIQNFDFKQCIPVDQPSVNQPSVDQPSVDQPSVQPIIDVICLDFDVSHLHFLNPPSALIPLSKTLFDFYYSPKLKKETASHRYGKKISDRQVAIFSLKKQLSPHIPLPQLAFAYLLILGLFLWMSNHSKRRLWLYAVISPSLIIVQTFILLAFKFEWSSLTTQALQNATVSNQSIYSPTFILVLISAILPFILLSYFEWKDQNQIAKDRLPYTYLAPALIAVFLLVFIPFLYGVALSFTQKINGEIHWVGLKHFEHILIQGWMEIKIATGFYATLMVTILWTLANLALHLSIGLGLALILNQKNLKLKGFYRVLLILPWAVPSYITALIWKGMFHQQYGLINEILRSLDISEVAWMGGFWQAFSSNLICNTWLGFPFMMVVTLGALQSIPSDLYEAAELDGASDWQQFKKITLPLLMPALMPSILLSAVWTFNMFNVIYLVSAGKPAGQTDILITQAYRIAFEQDQHGYAAAYSMVIFLILLVFALFSQKWSKKTESLY